LHQTKENFPKKKSQQVKGLKFAERGKKRVGKKKKGGKGKGKENVNSEAASMERKGEKGYIWQQGETKNQKRVKRDTKRAVWEKKSGHVISMRKKSLNY